MYARMPARQSVSFFLSFFLSLSLCLSVWNVVQRYAKQCNALQCHVMYVVENKYAYR